MVRPLRIEYDEAWYHVLNRGLERRSLFLDSQDYEKFLALLKEITETFSIEVHAFSLMPNHYHLLVHTPRAGLSRAMRHLNGVYTQYFNRRHRRDGPLLKGRYKARLIDSNEYLIELVRYIHCNPVKAKMCEKPKDHTWTSHRYYLKDVEGFEWLKREAVLSDYGKDVDGARKRFDVIVRSKMSEGVIKEIEQPTNSIIGGKNFKKWINSNYVEFKHRKNKCVSSKEKEVVSGLTGKDILENIRHCYNMSMAELRLTQTGQRNEARSLAIYLMRNRLGYSLKKIGLWFKIENEYAIAKALSRFKFALASDRNFMKRVKEMERAVMRRACP